MNKAITILSGLIIFMVSSCSSSNELTREQRNELKLEQQKSGLSEVKKLIDSGTYTFIAQSVNPTGGKSIQLNSSTYSMDFKDNIVKADMPFIGRGYTSHYAGEPGIKFEGEPISYNLTENEKKGSILVSFRVKGSNETFDITMRISSSSYGSLTVMSQNRQGISYNGYIREMP